MFWYLEFDGALCSFSLMKVVMITDVHRTRCAEVFLHRLGGGRDHKNEVCFLLLICLQYRVLNLIKPSGEVILYSAKQKNLIRFECRSTFWSMTLQTEVQFYFKQRGKILH